jgi:hypothetical protein
MEFYKIFIKNEGVTFNEQEKGESAYLSPTYRDRNTHFQESGKSDAIEG